MLEELRRLLDRPARRQYIVLVVLSIFASLVQTAGVAAISLFFTVLLGGALPEKFQAVVGDLDFAILGGGVLILLVLGTSASAITTYYGIKLSWGQYQLIAARLLERYLGNAYEWHLARNSATLANGVISETYAIVIGILQQVVLLLVRGSEIVFIGALLVTARPLVALVAICSFAAVYGGLYTINRGYIELQGATVTKANADRHRAVNEALAGLKAIKVLRCERFFLENFEKAAQTSSRATANIQYFSLMPKYMIEVLIFGGLVSFMVVAHARGWDTSESIPTLALYGAAAIRLLPAAQQFYSSLMAIGGARPSLRNVLRDLDESGDATGAERRMFRDADTALLSLRKVEYTYAAADMPSLRGIDLVISPGEKIGVVGTTGAGKTTLGDIVLGLLSPTGGQVVRAAEDEPSQSFVAYVPQQLHFVDDNFAANIALGLREHERDYARIYDVARRAHIHDHIESLPNGYSTPLGEQGARLSGGQRQRIGIARALYRQPRLLVLDEASNALDAETERQVVTSLLEQDLTLLIIAHRISILRGCSRIIVLNNGKIAAEGTYDELMASSPQFRRLGDEEIFSESSADQTLAHQ